MKMRFVLPALLAMIVFQLAPQAAWSHCGWHDGCGYRSYGYGGVSPWQARQMYRAERASYGYGGYAPYGGGYGYPGYYRRGGLASGIARAIF